MQPRALLLALAATTAVLAASLAGAAPPAARTYEGPGVVVTSFALKGASVATQATILDNGAVVCRDADNDGFLESGVGGVCIPFDELGGDSVYAHDESTPDEALAFQVCVDANADGVCGSLAFDGPIVGGCRDLIFFSHDSRTGSNANPLAVHPDEAREYWQACGGQGFPGYVVITCAGVHNSGAVTSTHAHQVTSGNVEGTIGGTHGGDYCGAPTAAKAYEIV